MINFLETLVLGIASGLISGLLSAVIMHIITRANKPQITISPKIACQNIEGKNEYRFKIVNLSKSYIKNMIVSAELVDSTNSGSGLVIVTKPLKLARSDIRIIKPYSNKDQSMEYALRFRILEDLETKWTDVEHTSLRVTAYCEHESNGVGKVFEQTYHKSDIVQGIFKSGKSMEINNQ